MNKRINALDDLVVVKNDLTKGSIRGICKVGVWEIHTTDNIVVSMEHST